MTSVHLYGAARTLFGKLGGALAGVRPDDLATKATGALATTPDLDPAEIGDAAPNGARGPVVGET